MATVLGQLTLFADWCYDQLAAVMGVVTANSSLFIVIFGMSIVGFGVGLLNRLVKM